MKHCPRMWASKELCILTNFGPFDVKMKIDILREFSDHVEKVDLSVDLYMMFMVVSLRFLYRANAYCNFSLILLLISSSWEKKGHCLC